MSFIAIKNTEHKGVYKEKDFNKDLYKTKSISYRKFKEEELDEALKWAGVKNIKDIKHSNIKTKTNTNTSYNNETLEIIMNYKNKGTEGVCITTKNFDEIILKLNEVNLILYENLRNFSADRDDLEQYLKLKSEEVILEKEKYPYRNPDFFIYKFEILKFKNLSKFSAINSNYINLNYFWTRKKLSNPFINKELKISRTIKLKNNESDFWVSYNDFTLNTDDIVSIQPLEFVLPERKNHLASFTGSYVNCTKISLSKSKTIEKIFEDIDAPNLIITTHSN